VQDWVQVHTWARAVGAEVDHVGGDNQPGDVLVTLRGDAYATAPYDSYALFDCAASPCFMRAVSSEVDSASIEQQVEVIRAALGRIRPR
jgi:hypothetical protein